MDWGREAGRVKAKTNILPRQLIKLLLADGKELTSLFSLRMTLVFTYLLHWCKITGNVLWLLETGSVNLLVSVN